MAGIPTAHDNFFRAILADKQVAIDYLKSALPERIAAKLDFNSLKQLSGSYVSGDLEKTISDVVFTCRRTDGKGSVEISLLVEHKSYRDNYTPLQVGSYLFSAYQQQARQGRKQLSPIVPVLFYHGKEKWEYWTLDRLFGDLDPELLVYIPNYDYVYNDIADMSDEDIKALGNAFLAASLLALKHAFDMQWLNGNFPAVMSIGLGDGNGDLKQALLLYYLQQAEFTPEHAREVIKGLPQTIREKVMSTYELLKAEGFELGAEAKSYEFVKNLIQNTEFDDIKIASLAVVAVSFVKKVRADMAKKKR